MVEKLREEQINPIAHASEHILRKIIDSQRIILSTSENLPEDVASEYDLRSRMLEGALESIEPALFRKRDIYNPVILNTLKRFLDKPDFNLLEAARMWGRTPTDDYELEEHLSYEIERKISLLGIDFRAMDFLSEGLPLYERSLLASS